MSDELDTKSDDQLIDDITTDNTQSDNTPTDDGNDAQSDVKTKLKITDVLREMKKGKITVAEISEDIFRATSDSSNYIIQYDRAACIGAASCAAIAPLTFFMDDENKAVFQTDTDDLDDDETILASAQSCPVFAIKIYDKVTDELLFPVE